MSSENAHWHSEQQQPAGPPRTSHEKRNKRDQDGFNYNFDHLTPEEKRVIDECKVERFYYRTIPLAVILAGAAHIGTMRGLLNPHQKYGSLFKVLGGATLGVFISQFSYFQKCKEKILTQIPNSRMAQTLQGKGPWAPTVVEEPPAEQVDVSSTLKSDYEGSVPILKGLDDSKRPTMDFEKPGVAEDTPESLKKPAVTYDTLRRKHREEYSQKPGASLHQFDRRKTEENSSLSNRPLEPDMHEKQNYIPPKHKTGGAGKTKNQYGDVWDD